MEYYDIIIVGGAGPAGSTWPGLWRTPANGY